MQDSTSPRAFPVAGAVAGAVGAAHVWVPRGLGNAGILLALALDGAGWPDATTSTARRLGCSPDTVRRLRAELLRLGLVTIDAGMIVPTATGRERLRRCDPLPRLLVRPGAPRRTLPMLRAAAVLYGETVGMRANRRHVRGDAERADLAGVHRDLIPRARRLLVDVGVIVVEQARRGRALLVRAVAVLDGRGKPVGSHGSPLGIVHRQRLAERAENARRRVAKSGSVSVAESGSPILVPSGPSPMQGRAPVRQNGSENASLVNGCPAPAVPDLAGLDLVRHLMQNVPQELADRAEHVTAASTAADENLRRLAADPQTVPRLLAMPTREGIEQVLAAACVFDTSPRRRAGLAMQAARLLGVVQLLALALDVVIGRPRNPGAVLVTRIKRAMTGGEVLTRSRADWPIGRFLAAAAGATTAAPSTAPTVAYSQQAEDRATADEQALLDFATAGSWRMVAYALARPVARERGWSPAWLAARSGVSQRDIEHGLATAAAARATA